MKERVIFCAFEGIFVGIFAGKRAWRYRETLRV